MSQDRSTHPETNYNASTVVQQNLERTAVMVGASGLIGGLLLNHLLADAHWDKVICLTRSTLSIEHRKFTPVMVDFNQLDEYSELVAGAAAFCCLGTTQKKAGSKEAFRMVDHDLVVRFAEMACANGTPHFSVVSSVGANEKSRVSYYLKVKGEMEAALRKLPFHNLHFFRPSLLLGERSEVRLTEEITGVVFSRMNFMFKSRLARLKPIEADTVARAMLQAARSAKQGVHVHHHDAILQLAQQHKASSNKKA